MNYWITLPLVVIRFFCHQQQQPHQQHKDVFENAIGRRKINTKFSPCNASSRSSALSSAIIQNTISPPIDDQSKIVTTVEKVWVLPSSMPTVIEHNASAGWISGGNDGIGVGERKQQRQQRRLAHFVYIRVSIINCTLCRRRLVRTRIHLDRILDRWSTSA